MVTVFATLGYVPESVLPSLRTVGVERLVVFASAEDPKVEAAVNKVKDHCEKADIPFKRVKIVKPYDLEYVAEVIKETMDKYKGEQAIFNITGGTKVMAAAALIVCFLKGVPTEYAQEKTMEVIRLPLMKIDVTSQLSRRGKDIVKFLLSQKDQCAQTAKARKALGMEKSTFSIHLKRLKDKGLVTVERDPRSSRGQVVRAIPTLKLLVMED
jgi:CRISPR locus-related DNA-binding protein